MKLIGMLDTEVNRVVAYGGEKSLTCFFDEQFKKATFQEAISYILQHHNGEPWLANEVRNYLQQCNESTIFLAIDCYNAAGEVTKRNARVHEYIEDHFDVREVNGRVYECLEMAVKLVSAVG
ncbi:hypothetical protein HY501_00580 [Candidatus Woesearchaeota archaeon]|nr:hypothetical protein [Candidatus Woesearchaeota archaeon]